VFGCDVSYGMKLEQIQETKSLDSMRQVALSAVDVVFENKLSKLLKNNDIDELQKLNNQNTNMRADISQLSYEEKNLYLYNFIKLDLINLANQSFEERVFPYGLAEKTSKRTVLHYCVINGNYELCQLLLEKCPYWELGGFLKAKDKDRRTVFHLAVINKSYDLCQLMLEKCPKCVFDDFIRIKDKKKNTALSYARKYWMTGYSLINQIVCEKKYGSIRNKQNTILLK
jgi:ankyrin repeat protein